MGPTNGGPGLYTGASRPDHDAAAESAAIARVLAGDPEAFEPIVRRYLQPAFALALRLLGHRHDAEDLVQDAFLAALANLDSFDRGRRFGPWFYRIVWTRGLNFRKSRARRAVEPLAPDRHTGSGPGPAAELERAELEGAVADALATLPERQRLAVQLFDLDGYSGAEIGEMLDISAGTVRWHVHEGRRRLRERLAPLQEAHDER